jgi:hypothetical protein
MKYAVEMVSVAMIYISSFIDTSSGTQILIGGDSPTHRQGADRISLLQESRLANVTFVILLFMTL